MSYILDALKKAERERDMARVPTLMTVHSTQDQEAGGRRWVIPGVCLAVAVLALALVAYLMRSDAGREARTTANIGESQSQQIVEPEAVEVSPSPPTPVETKDVSDAIARPFASGTANPPAAPATPRRRLPVEATGILGSRPSQIPEQIPGGEKTAAQLPAAAPVAEQRTAGNVPASEVSPPATLREAMAKMTMTILLYSETKSERMAFINDRKYVEGEYVEGRYLLESITPDGALLSFQGERALLKPKAR